MTQKRRKMTRITMKREAITIMLLPQDPMVSEEFTNNLEEGVVQITTMPNRRVRTST